MTTPKVALIGSRILPAQAALFNYVCDHYDLDLTLLLSSDKRTALLDGTEVTSANLRQRILRGKSLPLYAAPGVTYDLNIEIFPELMSGKYDLYILAGYHLFATQIAFLISIIKAIPYILYIETHGNAGPEGKIKRLAKNGFISLVVRLASAHLALSSWAKDFLVTQGAEAEKVFTVPYLPPEGARLPITAASAKELLRKNHGLNPGRPTALWVGRMVDSKGLETLLAAFQRLQQSTPAQLVLVGSGPEEARLREQARALGLREVHFAGPKNRGDLQDFYRLADVFAFPSLREPFGAVIPEAMAHGLPIVTTAVVGAGADFVVHGGNGFITAPDNAPALAESLFRIIREKSLRKEMGRKSLEIMGRYSREKNAATFMQAINAALGKNS